MMSWIWTGILIISIFCSFLTGSGGKLAPAALQGAQEAHKGPAAHGSPAIIPVQLFPEQENRRALICSLWVDTDFSYVSLCEQDTV